MESHKRLPLLNEWLLVFVLPFVFLSCNTKPKLVDVDPAFSKYIDAYSSGVVSKKSVVRIALATDASTTHTVNETIKDQLFEFSPAVSGKAYWIDARTIEFKPDKDLSVDQLYEVSFKLNKVMNVPSQFGTFKFNLQTIKPSFEVNENGLRAVNKQSMSLSGQLVTADVETSANVEKLLNAALNNKAIKILWQHNEAAKTHDFVINNIPRENNATSLLLSWNGNALGVNNINGQKEIAIPAQGDFKVLDVRAMQEDEQYAVVQFSDPLSVGQVLDGLITMSDQDAISYSILGSEVKVYASNKLDGNYTMNILEGIQNLWGDKLSKTFTSNVVFENREPSVKIQGTGNILPNSSGKLVLPFDATNLKAVDVSIIKIYENNVAQFFQSNDYNGDNDLRRVGKPLVQATVKLDDDKTLNLHKKNRFALDLDRYIHAEPGAIYRINIGFRPGYSLYTCDSMILQASYEYYDENDDDNSVDDDEDFWNRYDDYYPYGYDWNDRENPCASSYYNKEKFASRNILASNIGLIAKKSGGNSLFVATSNLITTDPINNVEVQVLDYQQQLIGKGITNNDGTISIELKRKPYLVVAKHGSERGYLKLDDGNSLALSRFDVSGDEVKNGIKAFIFGERGVWRPGDSLFLSCIVDDKENKLPKDHPVEMDLISPKGQLYKKIVQTNADDGFNVFRTATDADAPTGNWICKIKIGGSVFEKKLKIETVMPNRLKIDLNFNGSDALGKNEISEGTLSAKWLFGAAAQNLKVRVDAQLYKKTTSFPKFSGYTFDNPATDFTSQSKTIFEGSLNNEGTAIVKPDFQSGENAPGQLLANLVIKVFEPGGNFSTDNISMPYNPYSSYIGIKAPEGDKTWGFLLSGKTHRFNIADVDTKGDLINGTTKVEVSLYKIQWRWWWDESDNDLNNFTQDEYNKLIKNDTLTINNGKGFYNIHFNEESWGRYLVLMKDTRSGHITGTTFYIDDYGWQNRNNGNDPSAAAMLSFTSDKTKYNVGDNIALTIPTSENGKALISIESGSKVLKTTWINTQKGQTKYAFKADASMSPNIYINVSLIQPHAQTINDLPIRMYGVIPVLVEDKSTLLKPLIKVPDEIKPEQPNSITISEANGKSMTYVIAIVDEGLLDLTRYKTPDAHSFFYAKEALGIKTWDIYDQVIGAWGSQLQRIVTIGGDAEAELASKTRRANRFKPIVQFIGPFKINGGSKTHNFSLPPYMGSVKVMVIAAGTNAYGMAEKSVIVKKPLMILSTLPRVLGPGETVKIPVTIFATDSRIKNVNINIESNNLIATANNATANVAFDKTGELTTYLYAQVKQNIGIGKIKILASAGSEKDINEVEIEVRNPNSLFTQVSEITLQPNQAWNNTVNMIGDATSSKAVLEISSIPSINLEKRLQYLITYPHGCIEQTTSSVFPQLVLSNLMDLDDYTKSKIDINVRAGIQKLLNFQTGDGGFSYWPDEAYSDEWGTNYAGNFLLEASANGYNIPSTMLQEWKQYERNKAIAWNVTAAPWYGTDLVQSYRLYLLALAKAPELGAMNRLKEFKFLTPEAKWRLAAAYQLVGQQQIALQLISGLPTSFPSRPYPGISFGSDLRDQAMVLETLTIMNRKTQAEQLVRTVSERLSQENWYSTQTTAYSLIAIAKYCGTNKTDKKVIVTGKAGNQAININSSNVVSQNTITWQNAKANVQVKNNGANVLYVRVINEGRPVVAQTIPVNNNPNVLPVSVNYLSTTGQSIRIDSLKQGTDFIAKVTIKNPGNRGTYTQMALTQIFPSGWEILNTRLYNSEGAFKSSPSDYMDIRDDRVYYYFDINEGQTLTYYVQLNAAYPGKFYWPGVYCEAMYDHTISGGVAGKWVKVTE